jgi:hypothetical protein
MVLLRALPGGRRASEIVVGVCRKDATVAVSGLRGAAVYPVTVAGADLGLAQPPWHMRDRSMPMPDLLPPPFTAFCLYGPLLFFRLQGPLSLKRLFLLLWRHYNEDPPVPASLRPLLVPQKLLRPAGVGDVGLGNALSLPGVGRAGVAVSHATPQVAQAAGASILEAAPTLDAGEEDDPGDQGDMGDAASSDGESGMSLDEEEAEGNEAPEDAEDDEDEEDEEEEDDADEDDPLADEEDEDGQGGDDDDVDGMDDDLSSLNDDGGELEALERDLDDTAGDDAAGAGDDNYNDGGAKNDGYDLGADDYD